MAQPGRSKPASGSASGADTEQKSHSTSPQPAAQDDEHEPWVLLDKLFPSDKATKVPLTDDGDLFKVIKVEPPADAPRPPAMARAYVLVKGLLPDGTVFMDYSKEEFTLTLGRGLTAVGLQMAVGEMAVGERAVVYCGAKYGFNDRQRPDNVPKDSRLVFDVTLRWFEKEKLLHDVPAEEIFAIVEHRRSHCAQLVSEKMFATAADLYEKALEALEVVVKAKQASPRGRRRPPAPSPPRVVHTEEEIARARRMIAQQLNNLAICQLGLGQFHQAVSSTTRVLDLQADNVKALIRRAKACMAIKDYSAALTDLRRASELCDHEKTNVLIQQLRAKARKRRTDVRRAETKKFGKWTESVNLYEDMPEPPVSQPPSLWDKLVGAADWVVSLCKKKRV